MDVVIATFGDIYWPELARNRAGVSARLAGARRVVYSHGRTLAEARNAALGDVRSDWVIFLDADDELEPGYVEAMAAAEGDLRVPQVRYVRDGLGEPAYFPKVAGHDHDCNAHCLEDGNWLVIGTAVRTELARSILFREEPIYEDWSFFLRCRRAGATVKRVPRAVYRAHFRATSRNRSPSMKFKNEWHWRIHAEEPILA